MNTLNFLDANVWLALLWERHAHSERARLWFEEVGDEQFFFCRFTQLTVLRLLTTDKVMGKDTRTMAEAWKLWDRSGPIAASIFCPSRTVWKQSYVPAPGF